MNIEIIYDRINVKRGEFMEKHSHIREAIRELRKQQGLTQKELSELTGFSQNTISNHENGVRNLGEKEIYTYAKALNIPAEKLLDNTYIIKYKSSSLKKNEEFGKIVKAKIVEAGLTSEEAAKKIHISKAKFFSIENGVLSNITRNNIMEVCKYFNISPRHAFEKLDEFETLDEYTATLEMIKQMEKFIDQDFFNLPYEKRKKFFNHFKQLENN